MDVIFQALIAGLMAGVVAAMVSVGIEVFGGQIGGVLGSTPSTIIPAIIGFWLAIVSSKDQISLLGFQKSQFVIPPAMIINGGFLFIWKFMPGWYRQRFQVLNKNSNLLLLVVSISSFSFWLFTSSITVLTLSKFSPPPSSDDLSLLDGSISIEYCLKDPIQARSFWVAIICWVIHLVLALAVNHSSEATPKSSSKQNLRNNILRGAAAFAAIFGAVLLSSIDPVVGGVVSTFPAIFGTAMISVWLISGPQVSTGAIGPLFLGSLSVPTMCILSAFWIPYLDTKMNTAAALTIGMLSLYFVCVVFISYPTYLYINWRIAKTLQNKNKVAS